MYKLSDCWIFAYNVRISDCYICFMVYDLPWKVYCRLSCCRFLSIWTPNCHVFCSCVVDIQTYIFYSAVCDHPNCMFPFVCNWTTKLPVNLLLCIWTSKLSRFLFLCIRTFKLFHSSRLKHPNRYVTIPLYLNISTAIAVLPLCLNTQTCMSPIAYYLNIQTDMPSIPLYVNIKTANLSIPLCLNIQNDMYSIPLYVNIQTAKCSIPLIQTSKPTCPQLLIIWTSKLPSLPFLCMLT